MYIYIYFKFVKSVILFCLKTVKNSNFNPNTLFPDVLVGNRKDGPNGRNVQHVLTRETNLFWLTAACKPVSIRHTIKGLILQTNIFYSCVVRCVYVGFINQKFSHGEPD